jgi:transposase-like protein
MRVRPTYTDEFKSDAVEAVRRSDRSRRQVARDLGVSHAALCAWYKREEMAKRTKGNSKARPPAPTEETAEQRLRRLERENDALRKENETLRMDREILKKAAAFFAKESE